MRVTARVPTLPHLLPSLHPCIAHSSSPTGQRLLLPHTPGPLHLPCTFWEHSQDTHTAPSHLPQAPTQRALQPCLPCRYRSSSFDFILKAASPTPRMAWHIVDPQ